MASIEVNKVCVKDFLESGKNSAFIIPEYQRPYAWKDDHIETLFNDLFNFSQTEGGSERDGTYFLGCIVAYENGRGQREIIDGQQRMTSLMLLLRAIYTALHESGDESDEVANFLTEIAPTIWQRDRLKGRIDYTNALLRSEVISENESTLAKILETGMADPRNKDRYSRNYRKFQDLFRQISGQKPLAVYNFIYAVLHQAILLPITAGEQDTALTIFSTLNDRGMPLEDADIFKAQIYKYKDVEDRETFIKNWQTLTNIAEEAGETVQNIFTHYSFYLRAKNKDDNSTIAGLRRYLAQNGFVVLRDDSLIDELMAIACFWRAIRNRDFDNAEKLNNDKVLCALDILVEYPNEFWKYPAIIYYLKHRNDENFASQYVKFLRRLTAELVLRYLDTPYVTSIKGAVLKLDVSIYHDDIPDFDKFRKLDENGLQERIRIPHKSIERMLLKVLAYSRQETPFSEKLEVEHIFPKKYDGTYFFPEKDVNERIEHIGNKTLFEKRLNIKAGNNFFARKKGEYKRSEVRITIDLVDYAEWTPDCIVERDGQVIATIWTTLLEWRGEC
ncbi:MAG: DUF262 domain-containing protein [Thermoguttaceae bacterium]|nr:DUF262 domain-containing protein [Thermoguttaceae bacterium]